MKILIATILNYLIASVVRAFTFLLIRTIMFIYVVESHDRTLFDRVTQHFSEDNGGLRYKLRQANRIDLIPELENSVLYIFDVPSEDRHEILYAESYFIGIYRPKLNFVTKNV